MTTTIDPADPRATAAIEAIHQGDVPQLRQLLADHPDLATAALGNTEMTRSLLHVATDWPGHFPNGPEVITALVDAGADVGARFSGPHTETALHWAASSDDVPVLDALLDHGADIDADGAVIGGGTALDDAVAFAQWNTARRLVDRGAQVSLFNAAALGRLDQVRDHFVAGKQDTDLASAFWAACHGGQLATAQWLLEEGADRNWIAAWDGSTPLDAARRNGFDQLAEWLANHGCVSATTS